MCGIAGILNFGATPELRVEELRSMATAIAHRGPDDSGEYVDEQRRCGLAFRRLSIIDVGGGHQPIANETRDVWVIFNGEIYNYRTLRQELVQRGHQFATQSDTEVIVHLYEDVGER